MSRRDDGSSAIELVLLTPVLIALVFAVVQAALLWNAQHAADAAAQQGARLARTSSDGTDANVRASTASYLHSIAASLVGPPTVSVHRAGSWATVTVTAHAVSILPGATLTVHGHSRGPVETFTADTRGTP